MIVDRSGRTMKTIGILLLLLAAGALLAIDFLPWWAIVGGIVFLAVLAKFFGGRILEPLFKMPFRAKGAVLRGAAAEIHSLASTPIEDGVAADDANRRFFLLEVTIRPAERGGAGFRLWEPGELRLVSPGAKPEDTDKDRELCDIQRIEIETEGRFVADEGMKYGGPQRLRLALAVAPDAGRLQFRYYFELFGMLSLPA